MLSSHSVRFFAALCAFNVLGMPCSALADTPATLPSPKPVATPADAAVALDVYKSETCTCCEKWISHLESEGFDATAHHPADLLTEKVKRGIAPLYHSCHTAVSADGYIFEGHIPALVIQRFLKEKPNGAIGLAVPGMPMGSPGMGKYLEPYDVLLLKADGTNSVYTTINRIDQQYRGEIHEK